MSFSTPIFDHPIPLTFDRVADDVPITSDTLLFRFPLELISQIVSHLTRPDLASLALIDADCRQLARSIQYSRVSLDLGVDREKGGWKFLEALEGEKELPRKTRPRSDSVLSDTLTRPRRIGPCIRHLRVSQKRPHQPWGATATDPLDLEEASAEDILSSRIAALCSPSSGILPHLVTLDWDVPFHLNTFRLLSPTTRHLRINLSKVEPTNIDAGVGHPSDTRSALESLILDVDDASGSRPELLQTALALLRSTSDTLRSLVWRNLDQRLALLSDETLGLVLSLPKLQQLHLEGFTLDMPDLSTPATSTVPPPKLRDLTIEGCTAGVYEYFAQLGSMPALRSLRFAPHPHLNSSFASRHVMGPQDLGSMCKLLDNNNHAQALDISQSIPGVPIAHPSAPHSVMSAISAFTDLRMLKLVFDAPPTDEAISILAGLQSLEVLWLTAGNQGGYAGWRSEWEIDHERVADALNRPSPSRCVPLNHGAASAYVDVSTLPITSPLSSKPWTGLPNLRTLIFTRDTYTTTPSNGPRHPLEDPRSRDMEARMYYRDRRLPPGVCAEDWLSGEECLDLLSGSQPGSGTTSPSGSRSATPGSQGRGITPGASVVAVGLDVGMAGGSVGMAGGSVGMAGGSVGMAGGFDYDASQRMWRELECVAWERWHAQRMRTIAEGYLNKSGTLESVYVGMVPVSRDGEGGEERDVDGGWVWGAWKSGLRGL